MQRTIRFVINARWHFHRKTMSINVASCFLDAIQDQDQDRFVRCGQLSEIIYAGIPLVGNAHIPINGIQL